MKFLLTAINAKYIHSNPAVYSLKAYAGKEYCKSITISEYTINNITSDIIADIYRQKPDAIGFSCYIWNIDIVRELIEELPKLLPDTEIWLGGPEVSFNGKEILESYPVIKGIMEGEGEETFKELVQFYLAKEQGEGSDTDLITIKGLHLRNGRTGCREAVDMNTLPFYYENMTAFENRMVYYESSRGCPFRCSYCLSSIDKQVRIRGMAAVKKELSFFLDKKVPQVKFIDRTFNCNRDHAMQIWQFIKENDNGITNFHFEIAADILYEEEIELLMTLRSGLVQLEIGVQSANERTLKEINRYSNIEQLAGKVKRLKENENIHIHLDLIAGLPWEDYESFGKSFHIVYGMAPHQLQLGFLKVLKGSLLYEKVQDYGIVWQNKAPYEVLYTKWLTYDDVIKLKRIEAMVEIYYNSGQFAAFLPVLEEVFEDSFAMYEELADFYHCRGYFVNTPARAYRYQVLLQFACEKDGEREALYRELLTYDFYLRENAKSRPEYAAELSAYKEAIWSFYRREEEKPMCLGSYGKYQARQTMKMTHLDIFHYAVWEKEAAKRRIRNNNICYLLFDYQERSPLTKDATVLNVTEYF